MSLMIAYGTSRLPEVTTMPSNAGNLPSPRDVGIIDRREYPLAYVDELSGRIQCTPNASLLKPTKPGT